MSNLSVQECLIIPEVAILKYVLGAESNDELCMYQI